MDRRTFLSMAALPAVYRLRPQRVPKRRTAITTRGDAFYINGRPTYAGRSYSGKQIEGLLMNVRVVQGIFDDLNPETATRWVYPDTKRWDAERNTNEFVAAMPEWKRHGVLAFTINLQGGTPGGFGGGRGRGRGAGGDQATADAGARGGAAPSPGGATGAAAPGLPAAQPPQGQGAQSPAGGGGGRAGGRGPAGPMLENTAIDPDGNLRPAYMARLE